MVKGNKQKKWKDDIEGLRDKGCKNVESFHLPQDRVQWWALVNTVMNNRVPYEVRIFRAHGQDPFLIDFAYTVG